MNPSTFSGWDNKAENINRMLNKSFETELDNKQARKKSCSRNFLKTNLVLSLGGLEGVRGDVLSVLVAVPDRLWVQAPEVPRVDQSVLQKVSKGYEILYLPF